MTHLSSCSCGLEDPWCNRRFRRRWFRLRWFLLLLFAFFLFFRTPLCFPFFFKNNQKASFMRANLLLLFDEYPKEWLRAPLLFLLRGERALQRVSAPVEELLPIRAQITFSQTLLSLRWKAHRCVFFLVYRRPFMYVFNADYKIQTYLTVMFSLLETT